MMMMVFGLMVAFMVSDSLMLKVKSCGNMDVFMVQSKLSIFLTPTDLLVLGQLLYLHVGTIYK